MGPVFGQYTVTTLASFAGASSLLLSASMSSTSARKRLYRLINRPGTRWSYWYTIFASSRTALSFRSLSAFSNGNCEEAPAAATIGRIGIDALVTLCFEIFLLGALFLGFFSAPAFVRRSFRMLGRSSLAQSESLSLSLTVAVANARFCERCRSCMNTRGNSALCRA